MKVVLQNLTKKYPGRGKDKKEVIAVNNFNFEIPDGKLIGLLGPSGCGKSTLGRAVVRLEEPTSGKITTHGKIAPLLELGIDELSVSPPYLLGVRGRVCECH